MEAEEQIVEDSSSETTEAQTDETEASSSDAVETEESLLSVVQDALPAEEEVQQAEEEVLQEEPEEVMEVKSEETAEAESEDFSDVPFHTHPRFRKLIAEKNEQKELATKYQTDSEQYKKITNFIELNNLTAKDAVEGFKLMAMLRNNPEDGYKRLQAHMDNVGKLSGQN